MSEDLREMASQLKQDIASRNPDAMRRAFNFFDEPKEVRLYSGACSFYKAGDSSENIWVFKTNEEFVTPDGDLLPMMISITMFTTLTPSFAIDVFLAVAEQSAIEDQAEYELERAEYNMSP